MELKLLLVRFGKEVRNMFLQITEKSPWHLVAGNLAELFSVVQWRPELVSNELVYLAGEISKGSVKGVA